LINYIKAPRPRYEVTAGGDGAAKEV